MGRGEQCEFVANSFAPLLLYGLFGTSKEERQGQGEGEERQPGVTADKSRGSRGGDPRAAASLEAASPGAGRARAGLSERGWAGTGARPQEGAMSSRRFHLPRDRAGKGTASERNQPWLVLWSLFRQLVFFFRALKLVGGIDPG